MPSLQTKALMVTPIIGDNFRIIIYIYYILYIYIYIYIYIFRIIIIYFKTDDVLCITDEAADKSGKVLIDSHIRDGFISQLISWDTYLLVAR